ncbi:MAG: penicillin amidase [Streptomyces sp.]|nr:penicillin amidase [Streptomyces sp.]
MRSEVYRDAWGIPHIRAGSARALAYAQGRNAAYDRAWQIEVERHRADGTSASFLGPEATGWDVFARQAMLADTARRCYVRLERRDPGTARWVAAYAAGVNAGLGEGARRAPEFGAVGLKPGRWEPWTPLAVWLSAHVLFASFPAKFWRDMVSRRLGPDAVGLFATDGPGTAGSNGWLISGERTASGAALLAGDPHRVIEDPGVYQQIQLACPEYDVVGLAMPGVPGIAHFGHTGHVAWAITNAMADYQDLYGERLRRRADGRGDGRGGEVEAYGPEGWERVPCRVEQIEVAGGAPVAVELIETARGPVILSRPQTDAGEWEAVSLRCPVRVSEESGFGALPALLAARTVADVDRALDAWTEPVNVVQAADTQGGLLHRVAGRVPVRHPDNGLRIVPAWDPRHTWTPSYAPLPRAQVRDGHAVMANERGLAAPLGTEFAAPHRARRLAQLLAESSAWTPKDMPTLHTDTYLGSSAALLDLLPLLDAPPHGLDQARPAIEDTEPLSPAAARLRAELLGWGRRMEGGSELAAAYARLRGAVVRGMAGHPALAGLGEEGAGYPGVFQPWLAVVPRVGFALETLLGRGPVPAADRLGIVRAALEETAAQLPGTVWQDLHKLAAWAALPGAEPPQPGLSGDHDCVLCTTSVPGVGYRGIRGPAARFVWDLADRTESRWIVPFGASGVPGDPHQRDQLPLWLRGDLVPVVTDWDLLTRTEEHSAP